MLNRFPIAICWSAVVAAFLWPAAHPAILHDAQPGILPADSLPPQQVYAFICSDEMYIWNNDIFTSPGVYTDTFVSSGGSDSIVELHLNQIRSGRSDQFVTLCPDVPLIWGGNTYTRAGIYCDTIATLSGCDSIACMHVSVLDPEPVTMIGAALCPGTAFHWNGRDYSTPGVYIRAFPSLSGCDSIVQLRVEALDSIPVTYVDTAAGPAQELLFIKRDTFPGRFGCDSIVVTRFLHQDRK